ncbi:hypothetical protein [Sapientia aquatica]|uniref:Uncharacterized protein n=1 Tax=Sapientia aquatica TaxID=1549640 RepID=A0A4R5W3F4_9BURK|nr:hypothetical protein [Sapientia aquatica]TDK65839.1 hypothetical protein E2I14_09490 [Sapientia aquatica]
MENLYDREMYGADLASEVEQLGRIAIGIANRWVLGWPSVAQRMVENGTYLNLLISQVELEKTILSNEPGMRHLSPSEILSVYEIREAPPY